MILNEMPLSKTAMLRAQHRAHLTSTADYDFSSALLLSLYKLRLVFKNLYQH